MNASDIMTTTVETVTPDETVHDAARLMVERGISGLPVVDGGRVTGMVSEGDLIRRVELGTERKRRGWLSFFTGDGSASDFARSHGTKVRDVMTTDVVSVTPTTAMADIASLMERRGIKRVPVIDHGSLVGLVTRGDMLRALATHEHAPPAPATDDRKIRDSIMAVLKAEDWAPAMINVMVTNGVVHLWGVVDTEEQRKALRVAAEEADGVKGVEDHLVSSLAFRG